MNRRVALLLACLLEIQGLLGILAAAEPGEPGDWVPSPITPDDVKAIVENSPFTRSLNLSDSLILTGIASIEKEMVVTLLDKNSKETYVVTNEPNAQGWKMMGVQGNSDDLGKVTAKIAVPGGEVVAVRFDEKQLKPGEGKPAAGRAPGPEGRGPGPGGPPEGGHHFGPPPEVREKFAKLSDEQRQRLFEKFHEYREKHPELSRDESRKKMGEMLDHEVSKVEKAARKNR